MLPLEPELSHLALGASLYVPATHHDLISVARGLKYPALHSLILDTEDAVAVEDLPYAYHNLERLLLALAQEQDAQRPLLFIRVRNVEEFARVQALPGLEQLDGFVLPKFCTTNMAAYLDACPSSHWCMPILETGIGHIDELLEIRDFLKPHQQQVLSLRIGATDLLSQYKLRRDCRTVVYDIGLINHIITQCVLTFTPAGFNLSAPVYECFGEPYRKTLQREVRLDLLNGLFGKTIIHPWQISVVHDIYRVSQADFEAATRLLDPYSPAVFKLHDKMHEKATHSAWAKQVQARAQLYGIDAGKTPDNLAKNKRSRGES